MKQKHRYRRKDKGSGLIESWTVADRAELSARAPKYEGSGEHKTFVPESFAEVERAALRSDASPCPVDATKEWAQRLLEKAVERGTVSSDSEAGFPRYLWARDENRVSYRARLMNRTQGKYKAHPIEPWELPEGFDARFLASGDGSWHDHENQD